MTGFIETGVNRHSVMEPGSSGSPLINSQKKVIGQLLGPGNIQLCPEHLCGNNPELQRVSYGKFSVSWTGNGATDSRRRLMDWLDPQGTNPQTLDGIGIPTLSGPSTLCSSGSYSVENLPTGATITWSCSSNITRLSAQGSNPCTFRTNTNGTGTVTATITCQGNTFTVQKGGISVGLTNAALSGPSYVMHGSTGTWTANSSCGNTSYRYAWYLKKRGTVGGPTLVGTRSSLTLRSIPANSRGGDGRQESKMAGDTTRGNINRAYYDLYVTISDTYGAEYTSSTMTVSTDAKYILMGYVRGDEGDECSDDGDTYSDGGPVGAGPELTLSPNPADECVDIRIDFGDEEREPPSYVMEILNTGSYPVRNAVMSGEYNRVNIQGLQSGYYVVRIRYGDTILTKPLLVE